MVYLFHRTGCAEAVAIETTSANARAIIDFIAFPPAITVEKREGQLRSKKPHAERKHSSYSPSATGSRGSSKLSAVSILARIRSISSRSFGPGLFSSCSMSCCFCASSFATVDIRPPRVSPACSRGDGALPRLAPPPQCSENSENGEKGGLAQEGACHECDGENHLAYRHGSHGYCLSFESPCAEFMKA